MEEGEKRIQVYEMRGLDLLSWALEMEEEHCESRDVGGPRSWKGQKTDSTLQIFQKGP